MRRLSVLSCWALCLSCLVGCWNWSADSPACRWQPQFQIASSSMAPTFRGPSLLARCPTCQHECPVAADTANPRLPTRCFKCGGVSQLPDQLYAGRIVSVVQARETTRIKRFDCIVFCDPQSRQTPQLKRVWGLPGESLRFENGELWIDGKLYRKDMQELLRVAMPVAQLSSDWRVAAHNSLQWHYQRPARIAVEEHPPESWLVASDILDDYEGNQGVSRSLHRVTDYLVHGQMRQSLTDDLDVQLSYQGHPLTVRFHPSPEGHGSPLDAQGSTQLACDQEFMLAICDTRLLVKTDLSAGEWPIDIQRMSSPGMPSDLPQLRLTAHAQDLIFSRLQVWRDQHLVRSDRDTGSADFGMVPAKSFFVLGDNLGVSIDSRHELQFVPRQHVLGTVADQNL